MTNEFEIKGNWWIANQPDSVIPGRLYLSPSKIMLDLDGLFGSPSRIDMLEKSTVHGIDTSGKAWSLIDCFESKIEGLLGQYFVSELIVNLAFSGIHVQSKEQLPVQSLLLNFPGLSASLSNCRFHWNNPAENTFNVTWEQPDSIDFDIPGIHATMTLGSNVSHSFQPNLVRIEKQSILKLSFIEGKPYSSVEAYIFDLSNFLTLLHTLPCQVTAVSVMSSASPSSVEVFFVQMTKRSLAEPLVHELLVPLFKIKDELPQCMKHCFSLSSQHQLAVNWFCNAFRNPAPFDQTEFLHYLKALECFHDESPSDQYMSQKDYDVVVNSVLSAIPENVSRDQKTRLEELIRGGNRLPTDLRLRKLYEQLPSRLRCLIAINSGQFIKQVVQTGKFLTELDEKQRAGSLSYEQIPFAIAGLKLFFILLFLSEIGIPEDTILEGLRGNTLYKLYAHGGLWSDHGQNT